MTHALPALAALGATLFAPLASAQSPCTLDDGYGETLSAYVEEASACIAQSDRFDTAREADLLSVTNRLRSEAGLDALERRPALDMAARAHALDMAARGYTAHADLEGRDHLYRVRALDRTLLSGPSGANVLSLASDGSATDIATAWLDDGVNAANLLRDDFTHAGIAVAEYRGDLFAVAVFARKDGELARPLPIQLDGAERLKPRLTGIASPAAGWDLVSAEGEAIASGKGLRVRAAAAEDAGYAALNLYVMRANNDLSVLKGPLVETD